MSEDRHAPLYDIFVVEFNKFCSMDVKRRPCFGSRGLTCAPGSCIPEMSKISETYDFEIKILKLSPVVIFSAYNRNEMGKLETLLHFH